MLQFNQAHGNEMRARNPDFAVFDVCLCGCLIDHVIEFVSQQQANTWLVPESAYSFRALHFSARPPNIINNIVRCLNPLLSAQIDDDN